MHQACPARGEIGIFNRSHYEDIVTVRVHELAPEDVWERRYRHVREWERMLTDEGTSVLKVFLHVSRDEQRARLQERLDDPEKRWKFRRGDLDDRARWDEFLVAYEDVPVGNETRCRSGNALLVRPPGSATTVRVKAATTACGRGDLWTSPVLAGRVGVNG